jgi:hypothetical protein
MANDEMADAKAAAVEQVNEFLFHDLAWGQAVSWIGD